MYPDTAQASYPHDEPQKSIEAGETTALRGELERLSLQLERLEQRLGPVLSPPRPAEVGADTPGPSSELRQVRYLLAHTVERVIHLIDRVEA